MSMKNINSGSPGAKVLAAILILGGVFGIGIGVYLGITALQQAPAAAIIVVVFIAICSFCIWRGYELWKGEPSGYKWGKILFAAQIPIVSFPGFYYEFYTAIKIALVGGDIADSISIGLGTSFNVIFSTEIQATYFGVNIIAIIALSYLLITNKSRHNKGDA